MKTPKTGQILSYVAASLFLLLPGCVTTQNKPSVINNDPNAEIVNVAINSDGWAANVDTTALSIKQIIQTRDSTVIITKALKRKDYKYSVLANDFYILQSNGVRRSLRSMDGVTSSKYYKITLQPDDEARFEFEKVDSKLAFSVFERGDSGDDSRVFSNLSFAVIGAKISSQHLDDGSTDNKGNSTTAKRQTSIEQLIQPSNQAFKCLLEIPGVPSGIVGSVTWKGACDDDFASGKGDLLWWRKGAGIFDRVEINNISFIRGRKVEKSVCKVLDADVGEYYVGECRDNLADGKGTAIGRDRYVGYFKSGLPHGKGRYRWTSGAEYNGDFLAGKLTGEGKLTDSDGTAYIGAVREGKKAGFGKISYQYDCDFWGCKTGWTTGWWVDGKQVNTCDTKDQCLAHIKAQPTIDLAKAAEASHKCEEADKLYQKAKVMGGNVYFDLASCLRPRNSVNRNSSASTEQARRQTDGSGAQIDYVYVSAESCYSCFVERLTIESMDGGMPQESTTTTSLGIHRYNGHLAGKYRISATIRHSNGMTTCSATINVSGTKRNFAYKFLQDCRDDGSSEY